MEDKITFRILNKVDCSIHYFGLMHLIYGVHTAIVYCVYEPFLNGSFDTFHKPVGFFSL